uniref:NudC domain-containing protein 1 n=1 Tax=Lygus hesperus TaxID=30085 RepID=A0A146LE40_LYGHE
MQKLNELRLDRNLLDKDFEGYKLSLSPIPVYKEDITEGVEVVEPSEDQYSFLHQRLFSLHNHLTIDPWNLSAVYFLDVARKVRRSWIGQSGRLDKTVEVMEMPLPASSNSGKYNASICFSSPNTCVLSDGAGTLFLVDTSDRSSGDVVPWKVLYQGQPLGDGTGFSVSDSRISSDHLTKVLSCVVEFIVPSTEAPTPNKKTPGYETTLSWIVISEEINGEWNVQTEAIKGAGPVDYVALEPNGDGLYVISEATFRSLTSAEPSKTNGAGINGNSTAYDFEWLQTFDDITVWIKLEGPEPKISGVAVVCEQNELSLSYEGELLLKGKLHGTVDPPLTVWNITSQNKLEVTLQKLLGGTMWPSFIDGNKVGKEILDPSIVERVNDQLAHLTSDKEEDAGTVLNALEECDVCEGDSRTLFRFEKGNALCTNKVHLGSQQWLLSTNVDPNKVPAFCMRNDVDGCIWMPGQPNTITGEWNVDHIGTLLAFGYVQASKTNRKFSFTPPDLSFVSIVDVSGHVIVYRKGVSVNTSLRNRRTGRQLKEIAVQQLVNLHTNSAILGAAANDQYVFILCKDALYLLHVVE